MKKKSTVLSLALIVVLGLDAGLAQAVSTISTTGNNFTMLYYDGNIMSGTNDVTATWDGAYTSNVNSTDFSQMMLSSNTPLLGYNWTAHHIRVFGPGTYTIDTTCTIAQLEAGVSTCNNFFQPKQTQQFYSFTVGVNQIAAHMLFDWNQTTNADIVNVWNKNAVFGPSPMYMYASGFNPSNTVWGLMSTDWDGDGINGGKFVDGDFTGFSFNFNLNAVPIPTSFWLFTSGLIGLFGVMRKRKIH